MSLRVVVAAPFRQRGTERLDESEFVVALSLDRDWFSPDQATRLVDVALGEGLLSREDDELEVTFDPEDVHVPMDFDPDETLFQQASPFEQVLDALVMADIEKQTAVAEINQLQANLEITLEAAAVLYARRYGVDVEQAARQAIENLTA